MSQSKAKKQIKKFGIFGLVPLSVFLAVLVYPFAQGFFLTFTDWNGFKFTKVIGLGNFSQSLQDAKFWVTLGFTLKFVLVSVILVNVVAFGLALLVTAKLKSSNIFRTFFFIPNLIGGVVLGVIWQFIFNTALVSISEKFHVPFFSDSWLQDTNKAFWALIIVTVWQSSGYMMIIYITGLISIEQDVIEAKPVPPEVLKKRQEAAQKGALKAPEFEPQRLRAASYGKFRNAIKADLLDAGVPEDKVDELENDDIIYNNLITDHKEFKKTYYENKSRELVDENISRILDEQTYLVLKNYDHKNSILIDDYYRNTIPWKEAGGIGIRHTDADKTISILQKFGL